MQKVSLSIDLMLDPTIMHIVLDYLGASPVTCEYASDHLVECGWRRHMVASSRKKSPARVEQLARTKSP
jgi:hypothetical protein